MTAPAAATANAPSSLDTWQHLDISGPDWEGPTPTERRDKVKAALAALLEEASGRAWEEGGRQGEAVQLGAWASALERCRTVTAVREAGCGAWIARPNSCRVRLCPDCERARAARLVERYDELADRMTRPVFWTLTIANAPPGGLRRALGILLDALAHLRRRSILAGGPCRAAHAGRAYDEASGRHIPEASEPVPCEHPPHRRELAAVGECRCASCLEVDLETAGYRVTRTGCPRCVHEPVRGGVYALEVTWNAGWHPHAHLLIDAPWISWAEMRDAWRAVTCDAVRRAELREQGKGGRVPRCDHRADERGIAIPPCRGSSIVWVEPVEGEPGSEERRSAVRETLKYVSKGLVDEAGRPLPGAGPEQIAELLLAVQRRRLVAGWGEWRHVRDDEEERLDPELYVCDPEVPELYGLPRICPVCGLEALWSLPVRIVPRREVERHPSRQLIWHPPPRR